MKRRSFVALLEKSAPAPKWTEVILHERAILTPGKKVEVKFLSRSSVGGDCRSLGFPPNRDGALLALDKSAPKSPLGPEVVPEREATAILGQLRYAIDRRL